VIVVIIGLQHAWLLVARELAPPDIEMGSHGTFHFLQIDVER